MSPTEYHSRFRFQRLQYTDEELRVMDLEVQGADFISEDNEPIPGEPANPLHETAQKEYFDPMPIVPAAPMIAAVVVGEDGGVTAHFTLPVEIGAGGSGGFTILTEDSVLTGPGDLTFVALAVDGLSATFTTEFPIWASEGVHLAYLQPGDGIVAVESGLELATVEGIRATNKSALKVAPATFQIQLAEILADGVSLKLTFAEPVLAGTDGFNVWELERLPSSTYPTYTSGGGTNFLILTIPETILEAEEDLTLSYNQPGDGVKNGTGVLLEAFTLYPVVNNSEQT